MLKINKNLKFLIAGILAVTIVVTLYHNYAESASTPMEQLKGAYVNIPVNIPIGQNISALQIPLTRVSLEKEGIGNLPYETVPVTVYDHNMTFALYNATTKNGTLVGAVATNIGKNEIVIEGLYLIGAIKDGQEYDTVISKDVVGCTQDMPYKQNITSEFPNGTRIVRNVDTMVKCGQIASKGEITLKPGESLTAYVVANMKQNGTSITEFKANVLYSTGVNHMYGISLPFKTIS